jgi:hypothetical protein
MSCGFLPSWKGPALGALLLVLTVCSGGTSSSNKGTSATSLPEQIKALEDSGQLPKLDRSSDIRGPDADNNGIRDDIDAWIAAQPITDAQKRRPSKWLAYSRRRSWLT